MGSYITIAPHPTYAPWLDDVAFQEVLSMVTDNSLVGTYRLYSLWKFIEQSAKLSEGNIIEIGVYKGGSGALMAKQALNCDIKDKVYLCDTFMGVVKASEKDSTYKNGTWAVSIDFVTDLISKMKLSNVEILSGIFPDQTGHIVENKKFRLCYIDVDTYQSTKDIFEWIWSKIVIGGIVIFDDYGAWECDGIASYVNEIILDKDKLFMHDLNGFAIIIKREE
jgi:O-methyltransferase